MRRSVLLLLTIAILAACSSGEPGAKPPTTTGDLTTLVPSTTSAGGSSTTAPADAALEALFERLGEEGFNGIVAIGHSDGVHTRSFGLADREQGLPVELDTVFDIGSITKQFTAAAILRLEQDGLLSVDDSLAAHLTTADDELGSTTLHELLTHTAGLPLSLGGDYDELGRHELIALAGRSQGPKGSYEYSNVGYSLLAAVIEEVTGGSYERYLHDALFAPAGMDSTGYRIPDWSSRVVAVGYVDDESAGRPTDLPWAPDGPWWNLRGNGGILSTADDMLRWHRALAGGDILDADEWDKLFGRYVDEGGGSFYGYGWVSFPTEDGSWIVGHNGGNGVFFADLLLLDDRTAIFVASNVAGADESLAFEIAGLLLDDAVELGTAPSSCAPTGDITAAPLLDDLPDSGAGRTVGAFLGVLDGGDENARRSFAAEHLGPELLGDRSPSELADQIGILQEELAGFVVTAIRAQDDHTFTIEIDDAAQPSTGVLTLVLDPDHPELLACVDIGIVGD